MSKNEEKKKGMNLPNKITCVRLVVSVLVLLLLCLPWEDMNIKFLIKSYSVYEVQNVQMKYIIAGGLLCLYLLSILIGSVTDFLDGYIARKYNMVTDFGKVMDAIADKVLVNGVLIILAYDKFIPLAVPVIIITRDIIVDSIKMASGAKGKVVAASWPGKIKTICMMIGLTLVFFYNMPFAFIGEGIRIDYLFVFVATVMSIVSGCQYYLVNKDFIFSEV